MRGLGAMAIGGVPFSWSRLQCCHLHRLISRDVLPKATFFALLVAAAAFALRHAVFEAFTTFTWFGVRWLVRNPSRPLDRQ